MNQGIKSKTPGIFLIVAALVLNPWIIGKLFSPSGKMDDPALIGFCVLLEILMLVLGFAFWKNDTPEGRRRLISNVIISAITLLVVEISLHIVHRYFPLTSTPTIRPALSSSILKNKPW